GEVRFESDLRTGALMGLYWAAIGWITLLVIADVILIAGMAMAVAFIGGKTGGTRALLLFLRQHSLLAVGINIANYLVLGLCIGLVIRGCLTRGVWGARRHIGDRSQSRPGR